MDDSTNATPTPSPMQPAPAVATPQASPDQFAANMAGMGPAPQNTTVDVPGAQPQVPTQGPGTPGNPPTTEIKQGSAGMPVPLPKQDHNSMFHTIFQALAGGPKVTYKMNANTGEMEKSVEQLTKGGITAGILAGAVTGLMQGMAQKGPNAAGQAAQAGFAARSAEIQGAQDRNQQEATADYKRS